MTTEQWKDIPGHEGAYQVSDHGRVRSLDHRVRVVCRGMETTRMSPGKLLKPGTGPDGYATVAIGRGNTVGIHRLVALAFIGPRPLGADVAHGDGNPANNKVENLRYATRGENNEDMIHHGRRRLTVEQVRRIRKEAGLKRGAKVALSREFGISQSSISDVISGRSYGHVV